MADSSSHPSIFGRTGESGQKSSPGCQQNCSADSTRPGPGPRPRLPHHSPIPPSSSPLRTLRNVGGLVSSATDPGRTGRSGSVCSRGLSLGSRIRASRTRCSNNQQEAPEALLDLVLECQGQRLDEQRASLSLLPDPGPDALCAACNPDQFLVPSLDFYYMLIQYQSHRMEDQRCPLPDLQDVPGVLPEGQEDFFSLVQRVQSRRMDEQRVSMLPRDTKEDDEEVAAASSSLMKVTH